MLKIHFFIRAYSNSKKLAQSAPKMKFLSVAEKNDAAKTIAGHLSRGTARRREGLSVYNKIYEFPTQVRGQNCDMIMTSVSGHLMNYAFGAQYKNWSNVDPIVLFEAPVSKVCPADYVKIRDTLEKEIRGCTGLIIWTDCDREGENIGYEIIDVCRRIKSNLQVYRAKFSEMTAVGLQRAMDNLIQPDKRVSDAVDVRQQLDLRIGAAFTRFQTMRLQAVFPSQIVQQLVSYGSCQIPTLGFVVQRFREAENFIPQAFWKVKVNHVVEDVAVEFIWARKRLFDKECCRAFFLVCQASPEALVKSVTEKPKSKWRPQPLDTVELEKLGSRKLRINAKETMTIAEKLYREGIISYPRTETNMFSKEINLGNLAQMHTAHPDWGGFAAKVLQWGPNPRNGRKSDQAHPPIHPTKYAPNLQGNEKKIYELVVRHFLACISRDATGSETNVVIEIAGEEFTASGLCIHERNYLEVYPYDRWNAKEIHNYQVGNTFNPTEISMPEGSTSAPQMLTEADLIALMEKHGIGTDATHAEHINTIKERAYIGEVEEKFLVPGQIGMGLVEGYDAMNLPLAQPKLRAELERDLKLICEGQKNPDEVLADQINKYREVYRVITQQAIELDRSMAHRLNETPRDPPPPSTYAGKKEIFKCPKCGGANSMALQSKKDNSGFFIGCLGFPDCKNVIWLSDAIKEIQVLDTNCRTCGPHVKKVTISFKQRSVLASLGSVEETYTSCLKCDRMLRNILNINDDVAVTVAASNAITSQNRGWGQPPPPQSRPPFSGNRTQPPPTRPPPQSSNGWGNSNGSQGFPSNGGSAPPQNRGGWFSDDAPTDARPPSNNRFGGNGTGGKGANSFDNNDDNDGDVNCAKCNRPATRLTVKREGPNKGRQFYTCKHTDTCNFFKWADENQAPNTSTWGGGSSAAPTSSNASGSSNNTRRNNTDGRAAGAKRKCTLCRQEGHTKNKCPRQVQLDYMS